jgi:hypothetical protein
VALASPFAPLTQFLKATSTTSTPILASNVALALKFAPAKLSSPANNPPARSLKILLPLNRIPLFGGSFFLSQAEAVKHGGPH